MPQMVGKTNWKYAILKLKTEKVYHDDKLFVSCLTYWPWGEFIFVSPKIHWKQPIAKLVQFVVQDSTQYVIAENWENQTALDLHNKKERLKSFVRNISQYLIEDCKISMSY